jgi:hypothetical protein
MRSYEECESLLTEFIKSTEELAPQGSEEWLFARKLTVGGSEISLLLGKSKYGAVKEFIVSKSRFAKFKASAPLWFGSMMEQVTEKYVEKKYNCIIYETGSVKSKKTERISYSPDGLAVVNSGDQADIVLFEFKSPFMAIPEIGVVPEHYISQPLLGMSVIPICDRAVFIEVVYKFCSLDQILTLNYSNYHFGKQVVADMIYYGGLHLYGPFESEFDSDLSILDRESINGYLKMCAEKSIDVKYSEIYSSKDLSEYKKEISSASKKKSNDWKYIGTLTYKAIMINEVDLQKTDFITEELIANVDAVFTSIQTINEQTVNMSEKDFKKFIKQFYF